MPLPPYGNSRHCPAHRTRHKRPCPRGRQQRISPAQHQPQSQPRRQRRPTRSPQLPPSASHTTPPQTRIRVVPTPRETRQPLLPITAPPSPPAPSTAEMAPQGSIRSPAPRGTAPCTPRTPEQSWFWHRLGNPGLAACGEHRITGGATSRGSQGLPQTPQTQDT